MTTSTARIAAEPEPIDLDWTKTALVIIDMQRDFMEPGGFGETLGNDVSQLARAVKPIASVLHAARDTGMLVIHTREGHLPDLSDAPPAKVERGAPSLRSAIRTDGTDPDPRRGRPRHHSRTLSARQRDRDRQAGQGAFYATELSDVLQKYGVENLLVCGVTTEVRQHHGARGQRPRLSLRRAVRRLRVLLPEFHEMGLRMIKAQGGIFGWVADSAAVLEALSPEIAKTLA
jgi:nicotinamidase-related amidase